MMIYRRNGLIERGTRRTSSDLKNISLPLSVSRLRWHCTARGKSKRKRKKKRKKRFKTGKILFALCSGELGCITKTCVRRTSVLIVPRSPVLCAIFVEHENLLIGSQHRGFFFFFFWLHETLYYNNTLSLCAESVSKWTGGHTRGISRREKRLPLLYKHADDEQFIYNILQRANAKPKRFITPLFSYAPYSIAHRRRRRRRERKKSIRSAYFFSIPFVQARRQGTNELLYGDNRNEK